MSTVKPTEPEEEYFARLEVEKKKKTVEKNQSQLEKEQIEALKRTHYMRCPGCGFELQGIVFRGLTVNKCFRCEGAFLTREGFQKLCGEDRNFFEQVLSIFQFK